MSNTLNFSRDGAAKTAVTLTEAADSQTLILKDEHTPQLPSTVELKRRLPGQNGTVLRASVARRMTKILNEGTESEREATAVVKLECSIPVGLASADLQVMLDDLEGIIATQTFSDMTVFGIIDPQ